MDLEEKLSMVLWDRLHWVRINAGSCECSTETSGFAKYKGYLD
jgi:hypothetical protein